MTAFLQRTPVLWALFILTIALTVGFGLWIPSVGGVILDETAPVHAVKVILANMSPAQKNAHFWMTLLLDIPYPFAYGGFFAGMALRFFGKAGGWLALPAFLVIPVDLVENTIQLITLQGNESFLPIKAIVTPIKLVLFFAAGGIAIIALFIAITRLIRKK